MSSSIMHNCSGRELSHEQNKRLNDYGIDQPNSTVVIDVRVDGGMARVLRPLPGKITVTKKARDCDMHTTGQLAGRIASSDAPRSLHR